MEKASAAPYRNLEAQVFGSFLYRQRPVDVVVAVFYSNSATPSIPTASYNTFRERNLTSHIQI